MCSNRAGFPTLLLLVIVTVGCGGTNANLPPLVPVSGTVTLDGELLCGAVVRFVPVGSTRGTGAGGHTDESGKYELVSRHGGNGAAVGEYRVVITKLVMPDGSDFPLDSEVPPIESPAKDILPPAYHDMKQTPLKATVPEGGTTVDFALFSTP